MNNELRDRYIEVALYEAVVSADNARREADGINQCPDDTGGPARAFAAVARSMAYSAKAIALAMSKEQENRE